MEQSLFGLPGDVEIYKYGDVAAYPFTIDDLNRAIDSMSAESKVNTGNLTEPGLLETVFEGVPKVGTAIGETVGNILSPLMNQLFLVLILVVAGLFVFSKIKVKGLVGG